MISSLAGPRGDDLGREVRLAVAIGPHSSADVGQGRTGDQTLHSGVVQGCPRGEPGSFRLMGGALSVPELIRRDLDR